MAIIYVVEVPIMSQFYFEIMLAINKTHTALLQRLLPSSRLCWFDYGKMIMWLTWKTVR